MKFSKIDKHFVVEAKRFLSAIEIRYRILWSVYWLNDGEDYLCRHNLEKLADAYEIL